MILFPNAKINIGLFVTSKRADGYHNLETVFYPVKGFCDALEVISNNGKKDEYTFSGLKIDGNPEDNLCAKALNLMRTIADIPPVKMHLHKTIPFGAGLGGGSADAAFMLKLLNEQYSIGLTIEKLETMASTLGADCPVFIRNIPVIAKGIGNVFSDISLSLTGHWLQIVSPPFYVATANAYSRLKPAEPDQPIETLINSPVEIWKNRVRNDFEKSVFEMFPQIETIKIKLYERGAVFASMTGSGSSVYGLFALKPCIEWPSDYGVHTEKLV
jgi:4-diphosphocytidyl-2-C-methyl-D-erythritol kinase